VRVSLFVPCFVYQLTPQVGLATAKVLKRHGPKGLYLFLVG
jgi:Fe-S oxidoreductase